MVTASMEVVPNSTDTATTPGSTSGMAPRPEPVRMKNMAVQASGKMSPQLMFGPFR